MTRLGLTASASSLVIPLRSSVPGAEDSIQTSEIFHNAIRSSMPRACFRSRPIGSLFLVTSASSQPCGRGPRGQLRGGKAEHIAAGTLDMDHFGTEFGQFRADIGLRDQLA